MSLYSKLMQCMGLKREMYVCVCVCVCVSSFVFNFFGWVKLTQVSVSLPCFQEQKLNSHVSLFTLNFKMFSNLDCS